MTESTATSLCPTCNGEMLSKDGQEFCPACLLQQGMQDSTFGGNPALQNWTPPPIDQLVSRFPNLDIESLLGQGGMGAVYKVRQKELDRPAALKILPEAVASDPSFTERFLREARLLASLSHPHIVTVYEFGERDGLYFILMEYVDGVTLRQASLADPIKRLAPAEALEVVGQLCDALQFAHDEGVVHRDIKPENILIDKRGRVKIADFGLARLLGKPADLPTLTRTHQLMGTPTYMAPEQIEGQPVIDHRADIYSLGVVFYELLTGELPLGRFQAPSEKVQLDARLDEVVFRTLEKEPSRRYQHASDVRTDMNAINAARATAAADASRFNGSNLASRSVRLLIVCWAFVGTTLALYVMGIGETDQQLAIGVAVAALTGALLQVHRAAPGRWKRLNFAAGFVLGAVLPALLLWATFNNLRRLQDYEKQMADVRAQRLEARALDLDRQLRDAKRQLSEGGGIGMGETGMGGLGGMEGMMGGGMGDYAPGMGGGMMAGGPGGMAADSYDSGSYDMGMGMDYGGFGMGMGGPPRPAILIEGTEAWLSPMVQGFTNEQRIMVSEILTDTHQKYLQLESDYSKITVGKDDSVTTTIYLFYNEWERLENELWTRLDEAVDVKQQRILRQKLKPEYWRDAEHSLPGLLGWRPSISETAPLGEFAVDATVRLRRVGKWVEAEIAGNPGKKEARVIPSSPELSEELLRFNHENTPYLAIKNARSALAREDWKTLIEQFTPLARFDVWTGFAKTLEGEGRKYEQATAQQAFELVAKHPSFTVIQPDFYTRILEMGNGVTTVGDRLREQAYQSAGAVADNIPRFPGYSDRAAAVRPQLHTFEDGATEYLLLTVMLMNQALGKPGLPIFETDNFESTVDEQDGISAKGTIQLADKSPIPLVFRRVDNNWKIDGILTPETSVLMLDPEPESTGDAEQTNGDEASAADSANEPESNQP
ncbi:serine/threonine-protein kinase [Fuerstiella marisgermanici]|uniref:Serine/threonine-protein kinase PknB n=1 Tax=Fuerstiella marisgermanici TaxID=1891926 RepID=A0A1P8WMC6_9PLAN|nr:serine/threonine-protein kinase [Fuerstiella marisgermanici]APZ95191.1 Serine/threonine-protein kinase PknB [Fuerstiella marisgermanici]